MGVASCRAAAKTRIAQRAAIVPFDIYAGKGGKQAGKSEGKTAAKAAQVTNRFNRTKCCA